MNYPTREPFVANTDRAWFDFLVTRAINGRVDEVNFWLPNATSPMKNMLTGEPIFFRLKRPDHCIAGYGFAPSCATPCSGRSTVGFRGAKQRVGLRASFGEKWSAIPPAPLA